MLTVTLANFGGMIEEEFAEHTGRSPDYDWALMGLLPSNNAIYLFVSSEVETPKHNDFLGCLVG